MLAEVLLPCCWPACEVEGADSLVVPTVNDPAAVKLPVEAPAVEAWAGEVVPAAGAELVPVAAAAAVAAAMAAASVASRPVEGAGVGAGPGAGAGVGLGAGAMPACRC